MIYLYDLFCYAEPLFCPLQFTGSNDDALHARLEKMMIFAMQKSLQMLFAW